MIAKSAAYMSQMSVGRMDDDYEDEEIYRIDGGNTEQDQMSVRFGAGHP